MTLRTIAALSRLNTALAVLVLVPHAKATEPVKSKIDRVELEAFIDKFFAEEMPKRHIPGSTFSFVKDGEIVFAKGYGYADVDKKLPVIADKTVFRIASVSKLFAATAAMQAVERGDLQLGENVNHYLKLFQLEDNFPEPVTLANLLTHTAGFDDRFKDYYLRSADGIRPLGEYLAARMPPRVMPPGSEMSYSNHGIGLAGYLVEVTSGTEYAQYAAEHILKPLEMNHSSYLRLPELLADMATGYEYVRGTLSAVPHDYRNLVPPATMLSTATDMAHFAIAHLQNGRYHDARILNEATAQEMHKEHFTHHPRLPGWAYGFSDRYVNNVRVIDHGGNLRGFASMLLLVPDLNFGFFVSSNNNESGLREALVKKFFNHYFPVPATPTPKPPEGFTQRAHFFTGLYRTNRYSRVTIEKLEIFFNQTRVTATDDGYLVVQNRNGPASRYVEVEPLLFKQVDGDNYIAFRNDSNGRITDMFTGAQTVYGAVALDKLSWFEAVPVQLTAAGILAAIFLSACIGWPIARFAAGRGGTSQPFTVRSAEILLIAISALNIAFMIVIVFTFRDMRIMATSSLHTVLRQVSTSACGQCFSRAYSR